jgi:polysaccharide biosynthesis protein PslG
VRRILFVTFFGALLLSEPAAARTRVPAGWMGTVAGPAVVQHPSRVRSEFRLMKATGVGSVKAEFTWSRIEPVRGRFAWTETDMLVGAAARRGLRLLPMVEDAPSWAAGPAVGQEFIRHPRDPEDYGRFLTALIGRYGPRGSFWRAHPSLPRRPVRAWEIWNEPQLYYWWKPPWRAPYLRLLRAAHVAIKTADPGAQVVLAGLTFQSWKVLAGLYRSGAGGLFDVVSLHPYTSRPRDVVRTVRYVRRVMRRNGNADIPIWITELSWTSGKGRTTGDSNQPNFLNSTPRGQARLLRRAYLDLAAARVRYRIGRVFWYTWLTHDQSKTDPFDYSGLRRLAGDRVVSKPALAAFRRVARTLRRGVR